MHPRAGGDNHAVGGDNLATFQDGKRVAITASLDLQHTCPLTQCAATCPQPLGQCLHAFVHVKHTAP